MLAVVLYEGVFVAKTPFLVQSFLVNLLEQNELALLPFVLEPLPPPHERRFLRVQIRVHDTFGSLSLGRYYQSLEANVKDLDIQDNNDYQSSHDHGSILLHLGLPR